MTDRKAVRALRYLAPNLITAVGLSFGMLSLVASVEGRYVDAAWFIIYAVLTDRLDGFVARLVRGTSELGVQLDSFADFLTFGVCPSVLVYSSLGGAHGLASFQSGMGRVILLVACGAWVLSATFRLARYNITDETPGYPKIFFGVPTTLAAGLLMIWYLAFAKYVESGGPVTGGVEFGGPRLLGDAFTTPVGVWRYYPLAMFIGAFLMASTLRMPKLGVMRSKAFTAFVMTVVGIGYLFGFARVFPEYLVWAPSLWLVVFLIWGAVSHQVRGLRPAPIFPPVDPPPGKEPIRPEDDMLPDEDGSLFDANEADEAEHHKPLPR